MEDVEFATLPNNQYNLQLNYDHDLMPDIPQSASKRICIIGAGPTGLAALQALLESRLDYGSRHFLSKGQCRRCMVQHHVINLPLR